MSVSLRATLRHSADAMQVFVQGLVARTAAGLVGATIAAALGYLPWPTFSIFFGTSAVPQAGMWVQIALTALCVILLIYLPANVRMSRLERSHRSFEMGMSRVPTASPMPGTVPGFSRYRASLTRCAPGSITSANTPTFRRWSPNCCTWPRKCRCNRASLPAPFPIQKWPARESSCNSVRKMPIPCPNASPVPAQICDELRRCMADIEAEERKNHQQIKRLEADLNEVRPPWAIRSTRQVSLSKAMSWPCPSR